MASIKTISKNIPYISRELLPLLENTSASVKFVCSVVCCTYFLSFSHEAVRLISVTPGYLLPPAFWVWTAFTYCFLELHFWEVCLDVITVALCGKLIEPLWGGLEMMTFFAIINFGVAILSAFFYFFLYMCTFNTDLLFGIHIHGLAGYIAGLTVAVKQIMPDHLIVKTPLGKLTNRNIPFSILFITLFLYLVGILEGTNPTMFTSGLLVSWIYLRFYQLHNNGSRGDMADNFTFASFFPNVVQPPIGVLSNTVYSGLVRLKLCRRTVRRVDMAAPSGVTVTLPGNDPHDMERRRQIALKALSERLSKTDHTSHGSKPRKADFTVAIPLGMVALPSVTPLVPPSLAPMSSPSTSITMPPAPT